MIINGMVTQSNLIITIEYIVKPSKAGSTSQNLKESPIFETSNTCFNDLNFFMEGCLQFYGAIEL